jgi:mannose-6-phosphate isomerase
VPPIRTVPRLVSPPWGGFTLASEMGKGGDPSARVGESWEVWRENAVVGAPGRTLADVVDFPLLVKLLDTREVLSVQVHPDDRDAARLAGAPSGKVEGWVVLRAEPGARIAYGVERPLSAEELRAHALSGAIEQDLRWIEVRPGDVIDVPPGLVHAIGGGLLLYEVQQPADITWRLYDWGRGRALHLDDAIEVAIREPRLPSAKKVALGAGRSELLRSGAFVVERLEVPLVREVTGLHALTVTDGEVLVDGEPVTRGASVVVTEGAVLAGRGVVLAARVG